MQRPFPTLFLAILIVLIVGPGFADQTGNLKILTYPIGLVTGELPVEVDLGVSEAPADLFLDGREVCRMTPAEPRCIIDLGPEPHVHLLELLRRDEASHTTERTMRWVNRPGQEAEISLQIGERSPQGICSGVVTWFHPLKQNPVALEVTENGKTLFIRDDGRSFRFPCPDVRVPHVLAASAIFADGRRAETVSLSGGFAGQAQSGLTAVPIVSKEATASGCESIRAQLPDSVSIAENQTFEVVFVLDPSAGYNTLMRTGWSSSGLPQTSSSTKQFDQMVQHGSKGSEPKPKVSWIKSESSLMDAEKLWFVTPNAELHRINGFGQGKMNWLRLLFHFGATKLEGEARLADAVAASGLVAASGPQQRAVVLFLGNKSHRDDSTFTPQQAQQYLAEVGVPLVVLRNGKLRDDGWPAGVPVKSMEGMADALMSLKSDLKSQCVAWFPGNTRRQDIVASLSEDLEIAGQGTHQPGDALDVWQRVELAEAVPASTEEVVGPGGEIAGRGEVQITATTVLVSAKDSEGRPVTTLEAAAVQVSEDGRPVTVLGLEPVTMTRTADRPAQVEEGPGASPTPEDPERTPVPVAIYVDRRLSGSTEIVPALNSLSSNADWLTSLGPVDIVAADGTVSTLLEASTDADRVRSVLNDLSDEGAGQHIIERIRTRFLRDIRIYPDRTEGLTRKEDDSLSVLERLQAGEEPQELERSRVLNAARSSIFEEDGTLRLSSEMLTDFALASPTARPRLLLVVGAGFDEDPVDFYLPFLQRIEAQNTGTAHEDFKRFRQTERVGSVGRDLAAAGWLVVPVAGRTTGKQAGAADVGGGERFQAFLSANQDAVRSPQAEWLMLDPISAQRHLAEPSGGEVIMASQGLEPLKVQATGWYRLSYQIERPPDGSMHALSVATDLPGVEIKATQVVSSETSEGQASVRVRQLLRGSIQPGSLAVALTVGATESVENGLSAAQVSAEVDFESIAPLFDAGELRLIRVSVGVRNGEDIQFLHHRTESITGPIGTWRYDFPLQWPAGPAQLALMVEDLESGAWGGAVQEIR